MLLQKLKEIVGDQWVIEDENVKLFSYPAFIPLKVEPKAVILPGNEEEVINVVNLLNENNVKYLIRGSGTSLSGSTTPTQGEIVVSLTRLNKIYSVNGYEVEVGPGVANFMINKVLSNTNLFYAPDPSSYVVSSIGGNISHDSGGMHTPKYGTTFDSVIKLKVLLTDGTVEEIGGANFFDPTSIFVGAEGTLGVILRATLRLFPKPESSKTIMAAFNSVEDAAKAVVNVYKSGVTPSAMEFLDKNSIIAIENTQYKANYPIVDAILLIELDGYSKSVEEEEEKVINAIRNSAGEIYIPKNEEEKNRWWLGRKGAFPSFAYYSPAYLTLDANVPRSKLPVILRYTYEIGKKYNLPVANSFHAGDGTLHPLIGFDPKSVENTLNAIRAGEEITKLAIKLGGVPSGEHGIGVEKIKFMRYYYSEDDLKVMRRIKRTFDPKGILNKCKLIPPDKTEICNVVNPIHNHLLFESD
ncbi:FAD-linked oxidase [Sulfolobus sp. A20]|uniref:FAD-binding oxidoreductase n=2 Tax=Sulfolobaceae TaxID=118883 RepID=UPI000846060E|nr:FAD-linked oxidase C-terminal domain-containing protein [Sulfolobus sp. A20]TRM76833.1 FAD-binding oxidoreductase [Sulfolobus sp. E5]TRM77241.1 FAD-binding oxidoreductase [Sulfolobus sp. A20-N-F8]TRM81490.1 FAD-binding oxidoreductase [Sulfolobus sp. D5]TRM84269.1 FAD-binding oxidoreductase [Sulfolobus sp. A20-N-F6]TRM89647.1 FAD-binding oxidoreductase [Sulfolobus sp. C3]TRN02726.1 FAD-binding oxidoreductase [Sulfolobus sp. F1]TRN04733.1 FAD-binding oxidoreductase [Sulfolobus sp. E1]